MLCDFGKFVASMFVTFDENHPFVQNFLDKIPYPIDSIDREKALKIVQYGINFISKIIDKKWSKQLLRYSNPYKAQKMAYKYYGKTAKLYPASKKCKKYCIIKPSTNNCVNFGQLGYEDYTKKSKGIMSGLEDFYLGIAGEEGK